jgi:hypothetical protein
MLITARDILNALAKLRRPLPRRVGPDTDGCPSLVEEVRDHARLICSAVTCHSTFFKRTHLHAYLPPGYERELLIPGFFLFQVLS